MTPDTVLLDTNVFAASLKPKSELQELYREHVVGKRIAITPQTVAETRYGALAANWGQRRLDAVQALIDRAVILPNDDETAWAYAQLRAECRRVGHPLQQKQHLADLWIAATAMRWNVPLVAHDAVFINCPGVRLVTELNRGSATSRTDQSMGARPAHLASGPAARSNRDGQAK